MEQPKDQTCCCVSQLNSHTAMAAALHEQSHLQLLRAQGSAAPLFLACRVLCWLAECFVGLQSALLAALLAWLGNCIKPASCTVGIC